MKREHSLYYQVTSFGGLWWNFKYHKWLLDPDPRNKESDRSTHASCVYLKEAMNLCKKLDAILAPGLEIIVLKHAYKKNKRHTIEYTFKRRGEPCRTKKWLKL